jgi:SAM-dependent methyltransferase
VAELERSLGAWFEGGAGGHLARQEDQILVRLAEGIFGYYLASIQGVRSNSTLVHEFSVRNRIVVTAAPETDADLVALAGQLPLKGDSLDVVLLRHTLDFALDPQQVLREVERTLIPEGRVLIVGFNPLSLWGLWRLFLRGRGRVPWCGHFLSYRRVADWLGLLGFDIEYTDVAGFAPPLPPRWQRRLGFLESLGRRIWPMLAGVYVVRAVKRVSTVTPVRLRWRGLRVSAPRGMVEPSARGGMGRYMESGHE